MIQYIDKDFAVAPQLGAHHMEQVAEIGFRTVINNRPDHEEPAQPGNAEIERAALAAGLQYRFVPVGAGHSAESSLLALREALANAPKPMLAFCRSGTRSQMLYLMTKAPAR
ncbi:MAG: TIGR01244 family phosphatase [Burkholderiaceae bacterium]|nr:TIGR01244 family phosphatase [Burkholderiaceae bacterium]